MKTQPSLLLFLCLTTSLSFSLSCVAREHNQGGGKDRDRSVDRREARQDHRIDQGVKSGQLTGEEAAKLRQEEKNIRQEEQQYKADGVLTKEERKDLQKDLNAVSKEIRQEKHDGETRPGAAPLPPKPPVGNRMPGQPPIGHRMPGQPPNVSIMPISPKPGINERQGNQQMRIDNGIKSGELTRREAARLERKEAKIGRMEKRMKADGDFTPEERARLQKRLDATSNQIHQEKQDAQNRP